MLLENIFHKKNLMFFYFLSLLGWSCTKSATTNSEKEDSTFVESGTFLKKNNLPLSLPNSTGRSYAVAFTINNEAYVGSGATDYFTVSNADTVGRDVFHELSDFWKYNAVSDSWAQIADIPVGRFGAVAFSINSIGYVGTGGRSIFANGSSGTQFLSDFYAYDPSTNLWTAKANFPIDSRVQAVGFSLNGQGYVFSGRDALFNVLGTGSKYDPVSDSWSSSMGFPDKRYGSSVFVYNNNAYILGGADKDDNNVPATYKYDGSTFTSLKSLNNYTGLARRDGVAFAIGDTAYYMQGTNSKNVGDTAQIKQLVWGYDIKNDSWFKKNRFVGLCGGIAFTIGGNHAFIGTGGFTPLYFSGTYISGRSNSVYVFYPGSL